MSAVTCLVCGGCSKKLSRPWLSITILRTASTKEFTPLTAVHVANVLTEQSKDAALEPNTVGPVDETYLGILGLQHRLGSWQALAEECAEPAL